MNRSRVYTFNRAINCLYKTEDKEIVKLLPPSLYHYSIEPGYALVSIAAFDFIDSCVGPFKEILIGILVEPYLDRILEEPTASLFPIMTATDSQSARQHNREVYDLPVYDKLLSINFSNDADGQMVTARDGGQDFFRMQVRIGCEKNSVREHYQSFNTMNGALRLIRCNITTDAAESKAGLGRLSINPNPLFPGLDVGKIDSVPSLERLSGNGTQIMFLPDLI